MREQELPAGWPLEEDLLAVVASSEVKTEDRMAQVSTAAVSVQGALRVTRAAGVLTGTDGAEEMPRVEPQVHAHIGAVCGGRRNPAPIRRG